MGTVFRKTFTKPMPASAERFVRKGEQWARWKDAKGKTHTANVTKGRDGQDRITMTARTYTAKFRDGQSIVREFATGCRDETAARSKLAELERRAELVRANVLTVQEDAVIDHHNTPLSEHFAAYRDHQQMKGLNAVRIKNTVSRLERLARECGFARLADLNADAMTRWLVLQANASQPMSPGNRNEYRQELVGFGNWCVKTHRLISNPFQEVPRADARSNPKRKRRSMTEEELERLLDIARRRPLEEARTIRRGKNKGQSTAKVRSEVRTELEHLGWERALIYKTLVLTGLRKGELASLTVGQLHLEGTHPCADLHAADEKNRQGSTIAIRRDLADELEEWLASKLERLQRAAGGHMLVKERASRLPMNTPLFNVPSGLLRILDRDLLAAGIAKVDERGRTLDLHALRHSFGTLLSKGGVAPRTAQAAMRHSTIDLTMNIYTDTKLLDVHGALDSLPALPLAPTLAPNVDLASTLMSFVDKLVACLMDDTLNTDVAVSAYPVKQKQPWSLVDHGCLDVERKGFEPSTSALRTQRSPN